MREPLVSPHKTYTDVTADVCLPCETFPMRRWYIAMAFSLTGLGIFVYTIFMMVSKGIGVLGLNHPVGWAIDITNFVFWIGIGHAGTLISA
ncbi:MAG: hydrogenase, partial [Deltaproteobacteria bacterium]|nr:hydrogenase [Deltaproteobacteria bacterium]